MLSAKPTKLFLLQIYSLEINKSGRMSVTLQSSVKRFERYRNMMLIEQEIRIGRWKTCFHIGNPSRNALGNL